MNYRHAYHAGNFADVFKHAAKFLTARKQIMRRSNWKVDLKVSVRLDSVVDHLRVRIFLRRRPDGEEHQLLSSDHERQWYQNAWWPYHGRRNPDHREFARKRDNDQGGGALR